MATQRRAYSLTAPNLIILPDYATAIVVGVDQYAAFLSENRVLSFTEFDR